MPNLKEKFIQFTTAMNNLPSYGEGANKLPAVPYAQEVCEELIEESMGVDDFLKAHPLSSVKPVFSDNYFFYNQTEIIAVHIFKSIDSEKYFFFLCKNAGVNIEGARKVYRIKCDSSWLKTNPNYIKYENPHHKAPIHCLRYFKESIC